MRRVGRDALDGAGDAAHAAVDNATAFDRTAAAHSPLPDKILRFLRTERLLHWAIALPFLGCLFSAAVLVAFYNPDPARPYRAVFAWAHRGCGAALFFLPLLVLLTSGRQMRVLLYNVRQAWVWTFDDVKWLMLMGLATVFKRIVLPDQGKFNAAEKLNFMMVMVFTPLLIASGVAIWLPDYTSLDPFAPWMFHCALAATALPLLLGHMFMATINPETRVGLSGMISGWVSREWAAHHYARWYREQFPHLATASSDQHGTAAQPAIATLVFMDAQASPQAAADQSAQPSDATAWGGQDDDDDESWDGEEGGVGYVLEPCFAAAESPSEAMAS